jgi:hypothetical protein
LCSRRAHRGAAPSGLDAKSRAPDPDARPNGARSAGPALLPYGQRAAEEIYSVSRAALNTRLRLAPAPRREYRFANVCRRQRRRHALIESHGTAAPLEADIVFAADGAG